MVSTAASSYRDRTSEFRSLAQRLKKTTGEDGAVAQATDEVVSRSESNKKASSIRLAIHDTSEKIDRLAKLAKRSSMFDDPALEIQELSAIIRNEITALNASVSGLEILQNTETSDSEYSKDRVVHATSICDDLKSKLMGITKKFKDVLTRRTEGSISLMPLYSDNSSISFFFSKDMSFTLMQSIKAHESRKQIFSTNSSRENSLMPPAKTVTEPPPWSNASDVASASQSSMRRLAAESIPSHHMEMSMLQQVVPHQENFTQIRATTLQNVESTISELGGIFTQLATMVGQQGLMITLTRHWTMWTVHVVLY